MQMIICDEMRQRALLWTCVCFLAALFLLVYPIYVIRPFRYQGANELAAALLITRYRPGAEILLASLALFICVLAWKSAGRFRRIGVAALAALTVGCAFLCRVNVYEQMFHPLGRPTFSDSAKTKLDGKEQVIAIRIGQFARAYPIRGMSYHHIVNDTLGGRAVVATY